MSYKTRIETEPTCNNHAAQNAEDTAQSDRDGPTTAANRGQKFKITGKGVCRKESGLDERPLLDCV